MRRLTEILAFPKAWYRRSIVRRLFLGDLTSSTAYSEGEGSSPPSSLEEDLLLPGHRAHPRLVFYLKFLEIISHTLYIYIHIYYKHNFYKYLFKNKILLIKHMFILFYIFNF